MKTEAPDPHAPGEDQWGTREWGLPVGGSSSQKQGPESVRVTREPAPGSELKGSPWPRRAGRDGRQRAEARQAAGEGLHPAAGLLPVTLLTRFVRHLGRMQFPTKPFNSTTGTKK